MSPTNGVTSPRSGKRQPLRDGHAHERRGVVVRTPQHPQPPGRCPLTRRRHSQTPKSTHSSVHNNDPGVGKRGAARTRRGPDPSSVSCQPRLGRERFGEDAHRTLGQTGQQSNERGLLCIGCRRRLQPPDVRTRRVAAPSPSGVHQGDISLSWTLERVGSGRVAARCRRRPVKDSSAARSSMVTGLRRHQLGRSMYVPGTF